VAGNHEPGIEGCDLVDTGDPGKPRVMVGLRQPHMNPVVGNVTGDHGVEVWNVDDGCRVCVAPSDVDQSEIVSLELEDIAVERSGMSWDAITTSTPENVVAMY